MTNKTKQAPEVIYLQSCCDDPECTCHFNEWDDVTWCKDKIHNTDVKYIRADHIEDVRGRSMADAAVGPCDCDPHIEQCPSCAPYLHEPLKPAGEEDKATYKQIADNYTQPADCARCAELSESINNRAREQAQKAVNNGVYLDKLATLEAELSGLRARYLRMESEDAATIAQQAEQLAAAESRLHDVATHCATVEQQLAAAEKDAERYRWLRSNHPIQELPVGTKLYRLPEGD